MAISQALRLISRKGGTVRDLVKSQMLYHLS